MAKDIYFEKDEPIGYTLEYWREYMKENDLQKLELFKGKRETNVNHFWCSEFQEVGEVGKGCGKQCEKYSPRNRKNGRCRFSSHTYEITDESFVLSNFAERSCY